MNRPQRTLRCPAKINLALSVGGLDDNGLHPIASWMEPISFYDEITVVRDPEPPVVSDVVFADDAPRPQVVEWPIERDLAFRALTALRSAADAPWEAALHIRKRIPAGAGLGGGSSDAAGAL